MSESNDLATPNVLRWRMASSEDFVRFKQEPAHKHPLHVRVALALGYSEPEEFSSGWWAVPPDGLEGKVPVPRYDDDWSYVGPFLTESRISLSATVKLLDGDDGLPLPGDSWIAADERMKHSGAPWFADGRTPLEAVCNLILKLRASL